MHGMKPLPSPRSHAFSLIELLVVIAIIAVLASMLLPVMGLVRAQARALVCQSNMAQIHLGILSYAADHHGMLPRIQYHFANDPPHRGEIDPGAPGENWGQAVAAQLEMRLDPGREGPAFSGGRGQLGVFNCPENTLQTSQMSMNQMEPETSYCGNGWGDYSEGWDKGACQDRFFNARLSVLQHADELIAFYEGNYYTSAPWDPQNGAASTPSRSVGQELCRYPHRNRMNICFADGHIGSTQLLHGHGSDTGLDPWQLPTRAACFTNGRAWYGRD